MNWPHNTPPCPHVSPPVSPSLLPAMAWGSRRPGWGHAALLPRNSPTQQGHHTLLLLGPHWTDNGNNKGAIGMTQLCAYGVRAGYYSKGQNMIGGQLHCLTKHIIKEVWRARTKTLIATDWSLWTVEHLANDKTKTKANQKSVSNLKQMPNGSNKNSPNSPNRTPREYTHKPSSNTNGINQRSTKHNTSPHLTSRNKSSSK